MNKKKIVDLDYKLDKLNNILQKNNILELSDLLGNTKKLIFRNFLAGLFRGIGIGIGVTILTAILIYLFQKIVRLNIPIIGQYITDIAEIVERNK